MPNPDQDLQAPCAAGAFPLTGAWLDALIQHAPVGIAVIDLSGKYLSVNPAYCELYGYRAAEMLGNSFLMVFAPEQREPVLQRHQRFLSKGSELKGEWDVVNRDGKLLRVLSESVAVRGADGQMSRLVYVLDITARSRAEHAKEESRRQVLSVMDALTAHICVLDEQGVIIKVNRAWREFAAANGGSDELCAEGKNYLDFCRQPLAFADAGALEFADKLTEVLAGRLQSFQVEYPCHSAQGPRWFLARVSRTLDVEPPRIVVAHDSVTELKLVQEALRRQEAELRDLAASVPGALFRLLVRPSGKIEFVYFSPGVQDLFGLSPEKACGDGRALLRCMTREYREACEVSLRRAVASGQAWEQEVEVWVPEAGAGPKCLQIKATPKLTGPGECVLTGVLTDVSARKQAETALKASTESFRIFFETMPQGVVYHAASGQITAANPAACALLRLSLDQMLGKTPFDPGWRAIREDGSDFPAEQHPAMEALRTGQPVRQVVMGLCLPEGSLIWLQVNATPLFKQGLLTEAYTSFEDITELIRTRQELHRQASTDHLTGAANRRHFMERLQAEYGRIQRRPELCSCVVTLDLDHFKKINDGFGHAAGDAVLRHVTLLMRLGTRPLDVVGRLGGEEFALLLPDTSCEDAQVLAERLRLRIEQNPVQYRQSIILVTVSIGISAILSSDANAELALSRSDQAMYAIKEHGRNGVSIA
ncbi:PAS domain S-box protein [Paucibacter sp. TC2R-5]|uniref:sensor domain-containing diguanylate cyclase n=1 Tax=Paucibacter sp. TC2R-5 TaxID=2893555 RepID=UPI0021E39C1D|nr:PAS domain S-box protein [Paucibacter sp. TC2R-5]MCV2358271.1 PAS domain S-box protein [Paucibacter sp. TC2R-5]